MIEIMHFLMGSDADKGSLFKKFSEADYSFTAVFEIFGHDVAVTRKTSDVKKILIEKNERSCWVSRSNATKRAVWNSFRSKTWKDFLGQAWFKTPDGTERHRVRGELLSDV